MATNLATILVGLGYDLSALEKGAPEAFRLVNQQTLGMSSEMKRQAREGAESWRLIDEALGVHVSRPLTRIVTKEFPAFASALQSVLGAGVVGALAVAGVEFFDKIAKKIEDARAAQEKFTEASRTAEETIGNVLGGIDRKILEVLDKDHTLRIRLDGATQAQAGILAIGKALDAEQAAAEKANSWVTKAWAGTGDFFTHVAEGLTDIVDLASRAVNLGVSAGVHDSVFGSQGLNNMKEALGSMREGYGEALQTDKLKGTHEAFTLAQRDIQIATEYLNDMQKAGDKAGIALASSAKKFYESALDVQKGTLALEGAEVASERQKAATTASNELYQSIAQGLNKLQPETDPIQRLQDEIAEMRIKAEKQFAELGKNSDNALQLRAAHAALASYEQRLEQILTNAKNVAAVLEAQKELPTKIAPSGAAPSFGVSRVSPTLGAGGAPAEQFDTFTKDQTAQLKLAAQAYNDLLTPLDRFNLAQRELNLLLKEGLIDQTAYTAAVQKAREEEAKATDQLEKLLAKTDSAAAGMQAFFLQLENQGGKSGLGSFTFEFLNKGLSGFEDNTVKALTGAKTHWRSFFEELDQMALKFVLNKEIASLLKMFGNSSIGKSLGLDKILGSAASGANPTQVANTTAVTANTAALSANTAALSAAAASGGGANFGGAGAGVAASAVGSNAVGTDYWGGGLTWVGENGPELVNLPTGASVSPSGSRLSSPIVNLNIDAKGAEIGVEDKIAHALTAAMPHFVGRAVIESQEVLRRSIAQH